MIYEYTIREEKKTVIPVRADSAQKADDIFNRWYSEHSKDAKDTTIYDLLDNGSEGIHVDKDVTIKFENDYSPDDIMLPEEDSVPSEPLFDLHVYQPELETGGQLYLSCTLSEIGSIIGLLGINQYIFPYRDRLFVSPNQFYISAIPTKNKGSVK